MAFAESESAYANVVSSISVFVGSWMMLTVPRQPPRLAPRPMVVRFHRTPDNTLDLGRALKYKEAT